MTFNDFVKIASQIKNPVILLEGTRKINQSNYEDLMKLSRELAGAFPEAVFRTGNAVGTDEAFAKGVNEVQPKRLQYILPYKTMGKKRIHKDSYVLSLDDISEDEMTEIINQTVQASPKYKKIITIYEREIKNRRLYYKATYLLRDTLKVLGSEKLGFAPANIGIFYVNIESPDSGGTGHTIRVCRNNNVMVFEQTVWMKWINKSI